MVEPSLYPFTTADALIQTARDLCSAAVVATNTAIRVRADTRLQRQQRRDWDGIWRASQADPQHVLHSCAYCQRIKAPSGEWVAIPVRVRESLKPFKMPFVSHGFCPDCIAAHIPESLRQGLLDAGAA
jgi:hypothetical protein